MSVSAPITFDGRVAVVTGAGGGLGRAYALELARRGARVVVNDVRGAAAIVDEIGAAGDHAHASHHSVSTDAEGRMIIEEALEAFGSVDVLINNAGIVRDRSLAKLSAAELEAVLDAPARLLPRHAAGVPGDAGAGLRAAVVRDLGVGAVRELRAGELCRGEDGLGRPGADRRDRRSPLRHSVQRDRAARAHADDGRAVRGGDRGLRSRVRGADGAVPSVGILPPDARDLLRRRAPVRARGRWGYARLGLRRRADARGRARAPRRDPGRSDLVLPGRRKLIIAAAVIFTAGALLAALAPSVAVLVAARLVIGLAVGSAALVVPLYLSEIAPTEVRGAIASLNQLMIVGGILAAFIVNAVLASSGIGG